MRNLLDYDPNSGVFTWKQTKRKGKVAGTCLKDGRWQIQVDNIFYKAHRLAWLYMYGYLPESQLDHKDRNPLNNSIQNLRICNNSENQQNQEGPQKNNTTGFRGVSYDSKRNLYYSRIGYNGKYKFLGRFQESKDAAKAYESAKKSLHDFYYTEKVTNEDICTT